jgi:hypothetical protein
LSGDPYPKSAQLSRGERRYRRKVASPKQWQAIISAKGSRCRMDPGLGCIFAVQYHHLVRREDGGDDVADNIIPLCGQHHEHVHKRGHRNMYRLLGALTNAEYAYMIERGGEDYPERAYGVSYSRAGGAA